MAGKNKIVELYFIKETNATKLSYSRNRCCSLTYISTSNKAQSMSCK